MATKTRLPDRIIALIAIISAASFISAITLAIFFRRRQLRRRSRQDIESWGSDTPPVKFEDRKQTHADRKVFSWLGKVDADADRRGIFRTSLQADRKSMWKLSEEEMRDLDEALERLRGRDSVISGGGRISMMGVGRASIVS